MPKALWLAGCLALAAQAAGANSPIKQLSPVSTSTREVLQLVADSNHRVWAATSGGILRINLKTGKTQKWNRFNNLPANEVLSLALIPGGVRAWLPNGTADFSNQSGEWNLLAETIRSPEPAPIQWRGVEVANHLEAIRIGKKMIGFPGLSRGTHVTGMIPTAEYLLVAIYGDGFWEYDGQNWRRSTFLKTLPTEGREITCAIQDGDNGSIVVGTRREGVFYFAKNRWVRAKVGDEPYNHNVQAFTKYNGALYASTLDDGLIARKGGVWYSSLTPKISSNAARQLTSFKGLLYARHGDGYVDRQDKKGWSKDVFKFVPRRKVLAMDADKTKLYLGQWGGWSEWDGSKLVNHFEVPELKEVAIVGVYAGEKYLWLMTQSRGVIRWDRTRDEAKQIDARDGLGDDWVTAVCETNDATYLGTFVGGLSVWDGNRWTNYPELKGQNVTAIQPARNGGVFVGTRQGLWRVEGGEVSKVERPWLDEEVQAILTEKSGTWVGTRTSINWIG